MDIGLEEIKKVFWNPDVVKYTEFQELGRNYLIWKSKYEIFDFVEANWDKYPLGEGELPPTEENTWLRRFLELEPLEGASSSDITNKNVWSLYGHFDPISAVAGFEDYAKVEGWYIGRVPWADGVEDVLFEMTIDCPVCSGEGYLDDEDCEECEAEGSIFSRVVF